VRLIVDGVKYQMQKEGTRRLRRSKGPPRLIINYIADRENPDIQDPTEVILIDPIIIK